MSQGTISASSHLLQLVQSHKKHFWVGEMPPFEFVSLNIMGCTNFRVSPAHHQRYDVVWYYEQMPSDLAPGQFELVLDELMRLIGEQGKLVIRYQQNSHFTIINLKHFLGRRYQATVEVDSEIQENGTYTTVFDVRRHQLQRYRDKSWTFAILTQGKRLDNVLRFFRSIRDHDPAYDHEILVVGPKLAEFEPFQVRYLEKTYREELAEISRKKNDIATAASCANLMIVHDRYVLAPDFFPGFEKFGYDFDFATVLQWYECGTRFPAYAALTRDTMTWSPPIDCCDYSSLRPTQYLNGGLIIAKTESLRDIRFNSMLFWNQAEDLELARAFRSVSLPPRVNCFSNAVTMGITPDYTKAFRPERKIKVETKSNVWNALPLQIRSPGKKLERFLRPHWKKLFRKAG